MITELSYPFRHWDMTTFSRDFGLQDRIEAAAGVVPNQNWCHWIKYYSSVQWGKLTCNDVEMIPKPISLLLRHLNSREFTDELVAKLHTGFSLKPDSLLWGAGLHVLVPHGHVNCHLDYSLHESGLERRLNLILFLNREWKDEWGGALELWDDSARKVVKKCYPQFGSAIAWESSDIAFHGVERTPLTALPRVTLASYYLAEPRPGITRRRALFIP